MIFSPFEVTTYVLIFLSLYFQVFLLYSFLFDRKDQATQTRLSKKGPWQPRVSIIVPCFNEELTVEKTIESLLALDYPREQLEIIAIDDGSTDNTWQVLQRYAGEPSVKLITKENEGSKYRALNHGLGIATGEVIGCLDADSRVGPAALRYSLEVFNKTDADCVTPIILIDTPSTILQKVQKVEFEMGVFVKRALARTMGLYIAPGPFSLFRRRVFEKLGPYREAHHTEDFEIALRMSSNKYRIHLSHKSLVYTVAHRNIKKLWNQRIRWTYGHFKNVQDYRFMLFNPRYGDVGVFVLPFATITMIATCAAYIFALVSIIRAIVEWIQKVSITGVSEVGGVSWFFVDTRLSVVLLVLLFSGSLAILIFGRRSIGSKQRLSIDAFYGLMIYGLLAPLWFAKSFVNALRSKQGAW